MKDKRVVFTFILIICIILFKSSVWAEVDIALDGLFADWGDKPYLSDPVGDGTGGGDIEEVRWYPDNVKGNLYLFAKRSTSANSDWSYSVYLTGDFGEMRAAISYRISNAMVTVNLYNSANKKIWSASGKWGESRNPGTKTEFYIPLSQLVSTPEGGYEIDVYFKSSNDFSPDSGLITISSVSTAPVLIVAGAIVFNVLLLIFMKKCRAQI